MWVCVGRVTRVCTECLSVCAYTRVFTVCVCLQWLIQCICVCAGQEFTPGKFELTALIRPLQVVRYEWDAFSCPLPLSPAEAYRNISNNFTMPSELQSRSEVKMMDEKWHIYIYIYIYTYIHTYRYIYISIYISAVKRLIASKIKVFVYIIYVCILCIFIMYI